MVTFGITDNSGKFNLYNVPDGDFKLQITYIGYGTFEQPFQLTESDKAKDLGTIKLSEDNNLLAEIVVKAEHIPITIDGDTVNYNAAAFNVRKSDAVEDLLKKLPGMEVDGNGDIKVQGEDVEKVLVDGKEFFGGDHKIATKNLPADAIEKVKVYDKASEDAEFSGIDDGNKSKTIDLKLKKDRKQGIFGKLMAGGGSEERFDSKIQLNRFSSKSQASIIGNFNNINNVGFSMNDLLSAGGGISSLNSFSIVNNTGAPLNNGQGANGDNKSATSGINYNYDFSKKIKLRSSYYFNYADQFLSEESTSEQLLPDVFYQVDRNNESFSDNRGHNITTKLMMDLDSSTQVTLNQKLNLTDSDSRSISNQNTFSDNSEISSGLSNYNSINDGLNYQGSLTLRKKLYKKGRILKLSGSLSTRNDDGREFIDNIFSIMDVDEILRQNQLGSRSVNTSGAEMKYTEPLSNRQHLSIGMKWNDYQENYGKEFLDIVDGSSSLGIRNELLSGQFNQDRMYLDLFSSYRIKVGKMNLNTEVSYRTLSWEVSSPENSLLDRSKSYILPSLNLDQRMGDGSIRLNYTTSVQEPSLTQLQPIVNNVNPLVLVTGNLSLDPVYTHNLFLNFHHYDQFNFRSFFTYASVQFINNPIINSRTIDDNFVTTSTPINAEPATSVNWVGNYSTPIRKLKMKTSLRLRTNSYFGNSIINNEVNDHQRNTTGIKWVMENRKKDKFDLRGEIEWDYTRSRYSISEDLDVSFSTRTLGLISSYYFSDKFSISSTYKLQQFSDERINAGSDLRNWNASFSLGLGESQRITIDGVIYDILNQGNRLQRNATAFSINETLSNNLGRYAMLKLTYSLSSFQPKTITFGSM